MSRLSRDLATPDIWEASLNRSLARRDRAGRPAKALNAVAHSPRLRSAHGAAASFAGVRSEPLVPRVRDLGDEELWGLSLGRSRARRRAAELRFVPSGSRARRLSLGTVAALAVGPAANLGEAGAAQRGSSPAPTSPPTTTEHTIVLMSGSTGNQVRKLQQALGVKVDGNFGEETETAVYEYQATRGLSVDGIVGPQTSGALAKDAPAKQVTKGDAVRLAQAALRVPVDGDFGPETEQAIRQFQAEKNIKVDGVVGPQTWNALHVEGGETLTPPPNAIEKPKPARSEEGGGQGTGEGGQHEGGEGGGSEHLASTGNRAAHANHPSGSPIRALQEALHVSADGELGPETEAALRHFQGSHNLEVDGVVGPQTWSALGVSGEPIIYPPHSGGASNSSSGGGSSSGSGGGESSSGGEGVVARVEAAANEIATRPYVYGGGHGSFTSYGYDCSGSVSYALHGGGLLSSPEDSSALESYGEAGPGRYITIYANAEHAYMVINGRRFDTVALAEGGSRWSSSTGSDGGNFVVRHPAGL
ncbi:MAG: NlpC/P60 family protein [Solirubrobacteraceae bacterium]